MTSTTRLRGAGRCSYRFVTGLATLALAACNPQAPLEPPLNSLPADTGAPTDIGPTNPQNSATDDVVPGALEVTPAALALAHDQDEAPLLVTNRTGAPLSVQFAADADWIDLGAVRTILHEEQWTLNVRIAREGLADGVHAAAITLAANEHTTLTVPVQVAVGAATALPADADSTPGSRLDVTPQTLDFGRTRRSMSALVRNVGAGTVSYSAVADQPWIALQNAEGSSSGQYRTLGVTVDRSGLVAGAHEAQVSITAGDQQATITVNMSVEAADPASGGTLTVSPDELDFGTAQTSQTLLVRYVGPARETFYVQSNVSWAAPDVMSGDNNGEFDSIRVDVDRRGLAPGEYSGALRVTLDDGTLREVVLRMMVLAPDQPPSEPELWVSSDLLDFGFSLDALSFRLRNAGGGAFLYTVTAVSPDDEWVTVAPQAGDNAGEEDVVLVSIDRSYLINGTFTSALTIVTSTGEVRTINLLISNTLAPPLPPNDPDLVEWPTSDANMSYVVMVQQYAVPYLGPWSCCSLDFWGTNQFLGYVTMLIEPQHTIADLSNLFEATKQYIRDNIPGAVYCTYISGGDCRKYEDMQQWPWTAVPYEEMPPDSFLEEYREDEGRVTVDMANLETMTLFADKIIAMARERGVPVLWMDNVRHIGSGGTNAPWTTTASFLGRITSALHQDGMRVISNLALVPWALSQGDADMVMYNLDGICMEMPFHQLARPRTDRMELEIARYRQWMDYGLHVEIVPHWFPPGGNRDQAHEFMAGMIMILRRPGDSIFLSHAFFLAPPHWAFWPRDFGAALGDYQVIADDPPVFRREFEHAIITVDVGATLDGATHGQAVSVQWR